MRFRHAAALTLVLTLFTAGCAAKTESAPTAALTPEQYFTLKALDGSEVSLEALLRSKKAVLLNFWATWCPPCREEIPDLVRLQEKLGGDKFTIIGIDIGESPDRVAPFVTKSGINYPVLFDRDNAVAESYKVVGIPTSLLVTSDGKVIGTYHAATPQLFSDAEKAAA